VDRAALAKAEAQRIDRRETQRELPKPQLDMDRLAKSIDQIALTYDFKNRPTADDIFTSQYLPPAPERKL